MWISMPATYGHFVWVCICFSSEQSFSSIQHNSIESPAYVKEFYDGFNYLDKWQRLTSYNSVAMEHYEILYSSEF